jgi:hypothetical protein
MCFQTVRVMSFKGLGTWGVIQFEFSVEYSGSAFKSSKGKLRQKSYRQQHVHTQLRAT